MPIKRVRLVSIACILAFRLLPAHSQNYLVDLGPVAPGLVINNSGQVVLQNYLYTNGTLTPLPAGMTGAGINNNGLVVGAAITRGSVACPPDAENGGACAIATYGNGVLTTYPVYNQALDISVGNWGTGINDSGTIVGFWNMVQNQGGPLLIVNGIESAPNGTTFGSDCGGINGGYTQPLAINSAGQITGVAPYSAPTGYVCASAAFLFSQGTYVNLGPGLGNAINASGTVAGYALLPGSTPASNAIQIGATFTTSATTPLQGTTVAYGINDNGFVVGDGNNGHAFFYDGVVSDLNKLVLSTDPLQAFVTLDDARGINNTGMVVVNGTDTRAPSTQHAYILSVPLIWVSPGPLTFASQPIGSTSAPMSVTLTNQNTSPITLGAASVTTNFAIVSNTCGSSLAATAQCTIGVTFSPTNVYTTTGTLTVIAGRVPIAITLSGSSPAFSLNVSIRARVTKTTVGTPVTLTWSALAGVSCVATGGSAGDGWAGPLAASGSRTVTESAPGTFTYGLQCSLDAETQSAQTAPLTVSWPGVTVHLTASPTTLMTGNATTLSWTATNATSCASTGGGSNDGWPSVSRSTTGSISITEPNPVISGQSEALTFTITCKSSASHLSASSSAKVTQLDNPPNSPSHGGGEFDWLSEMFLSWMFALEMRRRFGIGVTRRSQQSSVASRSDTREPKFEDSFRSIKAKSTFSRTR